MFRIPFILTTALTLMALPGMAEAAEAANPGDTAWMLISTALVLIMLPGLALFYAGMVRSKNVLSTSMHTFAAMAIIGVQWVVIGYSLAFGGEGSFIGGLRHMFLAGITPDSLDRFHSHLCLRHVPRHVCHHYRCAYFGRRGRPHEVFQPIASSSCCGPPWYTTLLHIGSGDQVVGCLKWAPLILPAAPLFIFHPVFQLYCWRSSWANDMAFPTNAWLPTTSP